MEDGGADCIEMAASPIGIRRIVGGFHKHDGLAFDRIALGRAVGVNGTGTEDSGEKDEN